MTIMSVVGKIYIMTLVLSLVGAYFLWMWFDTYYVIEDDKLLYKSAFLKGSINIDTITEIIKNKKMFSGVKAALSNKGLVVKFNRWDDIYISPKEVDLFIKKIKEINTHILVTD